MTWHIFKQRDTFLLYLLFLPLHALSSPLSPSVSWRYNYMFRVWKLLGKSDPFYNQVNRKSVCRKSEACLYLMFRNLYEIHRNVNTIVKYCTRILHMKFNVISEVEKGCLRRLSKVLFRNSWSSLESVCIYNVASQEYRKSEGNIRQIHYITFFTDNFPEIFDPLPT